MSNVEEKVVDDDNADDLWWENLPDDVRQDLLDHYWDLASEIRFELYVLGIKVLYQEVEWDDSIALGFIFSDRATLDRFVELIGEVEYCIWDSYSLVRCIGGPEVWLPRWHAHTALRMLRRLTSLFVTEEQKEEIRCRWAEQWTVPILDF